MSEREEKLINKICKLQKEHNSLKLEEEIQKFKNEIHTKEKDIENIKKEIKKLSSKLEKLENNTENNSSSNKEKMIDDKKNILNNLVIRNNVMSQQLNMLNSHSENFKNKNYILQIIQNWNPEQMFNYIRLYDKKPE